MTQRKDTAAKKKAREEREKRAMEAYERVLAKHELLRTYDDPDELDEKTGKIPKNIHRYFSSIP